MAVYLLLFTLVFAWARATSALLFTNSFDGWVGNSTHTLTWTMLPEDPDYFNLTFVHPVRSNSAGMVVDSKEPVDWYWDFAIDFPKSNGLTIDVTLPPSLSPGIYSIFMRNGTVTPLTKTFIIESKRPLYYVNVGAAKQTFVSDSVQSSVPSPTTLEPSSVATTIASFVEVTATESAIATQDGHVITVMPSEVFSSAVVYTTIIVENGIVRSGSPSKGEMIVGLVLGIVFLLTLPLVIWLVLRYRRRPTPPSKENEHLHPYRLDSDHSTVDLLGPKRNHVANADEESRDSGRGWATTDGEKRLTTMTRQPTLGANLDPFVDPTHTNAPLQQLPRLVIPESSPRPVDPSLPTASPNDQLTPLSSRHTSTTASPSTPSLGISDIRAKISRGRQQRTSPSPSPRALSPEELSARIFVPGRAVDMGPLERARARDVDENGLLPPDYSQATQPISTWAGPRL